MYMFSLMSVLLHIVVVWVEVKWRRND